eukprot:TRINITY_DN28_c0_g1_i7.p1 TRINITY_DN28_c0_g1~~TRINITY_DN28_c0_g1_i7.p1  ORF type:complete len:711 (-),score=123.79 TRINITY_DN28_c0_g1_i7:163-2196(-)
MFGVEKIRETFVKAKQSQRAVFIAYFTAGHPSIEDTIPIMLAFQQAGVDIIEVGVPHSDPIGDGHTIQASSVVAIENGMTTSLVIEIVAQARKQGLVVPIVLMGYTNPFYKYGEERLVQDCKRAGVDGFIVVDSPPEACRNFISICNSEGISFIPLVAPTTSPERMRKISSIADSFVYCVSLLGVTGRRSNVSTELVKFIQDVRNNVEWPIAIGFGVSTREIKDHYSTLGEGVVVGSVFVETLNNAEPNKRAKDIFDQAEYFCKDPTPVVLDPPRVVINELKPQLQEPSSSIFGSFGGRYVPETLMSALEELQEAYNMASKDPLFQDAIKSTYSYVGRPTPLYHATNLSKEGGAQIWLKREDLSHTGAHKINNAIGQALLAKRMGKTRIIAETGAGQHGVATATICAKMGFECCVYMGEVDIARQSLNVFKMKLLGATVIPVTTGSKTLKDAINEAMRDWVTNIRTTHYLVGSAIGPHPFPTIVRDFQSIIGKETKVQALESIGRLPDYVLACVGGGSNAIGMFHPFIGESSVKIIGVEAAGHGVETTEHCATLQKGTIGVLHGTRTMLMQSSDGQISGTHSISAGLDYPGVGPEHSWLQESGRATYVSIDDKEAMVGFRALTRKEGIIPALESSHALSYALLLAKTLDPSKIIIVCLSGRGDKDMGTVAEVEGVTL